MKHQFHTKNLEVDRFKSIHLNWVKETISFNKLDIINNASVIKTKGLYNHNNYRVKCI